MLWLNRKFLLNVLEAARRGKEEFVARDRVQARRQSPERAPRVRRPRRHRVHHVVFYASEY